MANSDDDDEVGRGGGGLYETTITRREKDAYDYMGKDDCITFKKLLSFEAVGSGTGDVSDTGPRGALQRFFYRRGLNNLNTFSIILYSGIHLLRTLLHPESPQPITFKLCPPPFWLSGLK